MNERIIIAGVPRSGKTTFALTLAARTLVPAKHTDDLIGQFDWSEASAHAATWFDAPGPWIVEGVAAGRALRKWLVLHDGLPCDRIFWFETPHVQLTTGQGAMAKGCVSVWGEILPDLRRRGVAIEWRATT